MLWIVLCATLAVVESGDWSAMLRAQQLFHEVYGKRIEAAKTSAEKSALAREIFELAKKESDAAAKMVELEEAKRLALEADATYLAIEIVRELAQLPKEAVPDDPLAEAERWWTQGEYPTGKIQAIELYFRSRPPAMTQRLWEQRISDFVLEPFLIRHPYPPRVVRDMNRILGIPVQFINVTSGYSMNVSTESKDIDAMVMQFPLQRDRVLPSSRWVIIKVADNLYAFRNYNSGLFLTWKPHVWHLVQDVWRNDASQKWHLLPTRYGAFMLRNEANGQFVAPPSDRVTEGGGLGTFAPNPDAGLFWKIVPCPVSR